MARKRRVTRTVVPEQLSDLLRNPPRATIAFNNDGTVEAAPVAFHFRNGRYWIGLPPAAAGPAPRPGDVVRLLVDDGCYHSGLRGVSVLGPISRAEEPPQNTAEDLEWHEILPDKVAAWDYAVMRVEAER